MRRDPAAREPGDPVRAEAIDLLACLASQPSFWRWSSSDLPGAWSGSARRRASAEVALLGGELVRDLDWRELYAEAEARLRSAQ